jgi:hypothetical protein
MRGALTISHNFAGETGYVIAVPRKTTAPLSDVVCTINGVTNQTRIAYPSPHSQESILFEQLEQVWYFIKFYRSSDGVTLDAELLTLAGNAKSGAAYPINRYEYIVNRGFNNVNQSTGIEVWSDPVENTIQLRDERLKGKFYWIEERSTGSLLTTEITDRSDAGGGFDLSVPDKVFNDAVPYIATVVDRTDLADSSSSSGGSAGEVDGVVILAEDTSFDTSSHNGKLLYADSSEDIITLSFPNLSLIGNCFFKISTHGGSQRYLILQLDAGDTIKFLRQDMNALYLGQAETMTIVIISNVMYVLPGYEGAYRNVGQRVWGDRLELNTIVRDGTRYAVALQPRLVQWANAGLLDIVSEAQWASTQLAPNGVDTIAPYKHKFTLEGDFIRVPDDRDFIIGALKNTDNVTSDSEYVTQKAGGYQAAKTSMKGVKIGLRDGSGGSSTGTISNTGLSGQDSYAAWVTEGGTQAHIRFNNAADGFVGVDETREKKYGMIPLLII